MGSNGQAIINGDGKEAIIQIKSNHLAVIDKHSNEQVKFIYNPDDQLIN